ncbi:hypothetical protein [Thalassospira lucentensis]
MAEPFCDEMMICVRYNRCFVAVFQDHKRRDEAMAKSNLAD